jgi:hypothetical protein
MTDPTSLRGVEPRAIRKISSPPPRLEICRWLRRAIVILILLGGVLQQLRARVNDLRQLYCAALEMVKVEIPNSSSSCSRIPNFGFLMPATAQQSAHSAQNR